MGKKPSIETNPEMTVMIELLLKDLKAAIINGINILKDIKGDMNMMSRKTEYIRDPSESSRYEKSL